MNSFRVHQTLNQDASAKCGWEIHGTSRTKPAHTRRIIVITSGDMVRNVEKYLHSLTLVCGQEYLGYQR